MTGDTTSDGAGASDTGDNSSAPGTSHEHNALIVYFMRRRDVLIAELREIDRLLGRPQTVPERRR